MKILLLTLFFAAGFAVAPAQSLLLDFGPTPITGGASKLNSPGHASGDVSSAETTWNLIGTGDVSSGLKSGDNTASSATIDLGVETTSTSNIIGFGTQPLNSLQGNNSAYSTGIYLSDAPARDFIYNSSNDEPWAIGVRIGGLSAGVYRVYVSGANTNASDAGTMHFFASAVGAGAAAFDFNAAATATATNAPSGAASWTAGVNYVVFSVSLTAMQDLAIAVSGTGTGNGGRGFLNSLEIVRVGNIPEPRAFACVAGMAALGACCARRGRRR